MRRQERVEWRERLPASLAQRVQFVEEQNAGRGFRKVKKLPKMNRSLSEIRADHGVEPY